MNGEDVTAAIRTLEITTLTQYAADNEAVRRRLIDQQRAIAAGRDVVTEGRDQATVVFPDAECKIFLTAGEEERARRRFQDLLARGEEVDFAGRARKAAPPRPARRRAHLRRPGQGDRLDRSEHRRPDARASRRPPRSKSSAAFKQTVLTDGFMPGHRCPDEGCLHRSRLTTPTQHSSLRLAPTVR